MSVQCEHLYTILCNPFFVGVCIGLGVGRCEHTIKVHSHERQRLRLRVRLRQDDNIVSMRFYTHSLRLTQRPHKHVAI